MMAKHAKKKHDTGVFLTAGIKSAESTSGKQKRAEDENEIMLKIAHDKLNFQITYTGTMESFKSLVARNSDIN